MLFALSMIIIFPIFIIASNHNAFFIVTSIILIIASIKNLNTILFKYRRVIYDESSESLKELEDIVHIDIKRLIIGIKIIKNLIVVLFLLYCIFYLPILILKIFSAVVILYWVMDSLNKISDLWSKSSIHIKTWFQNMFFLIVNALTIVIISVVSYLKIIKGFY
jgi:hypothetical protein